MEADLRNTCLERRERLQDLRVVARDDFPSALRFVQHVRGVHAALGAVLGVKGRHEGRTAPSQGFDGAAGFEGARPLVTEVAV